MRHISYSVVLAALMTASAHGQAVSVPQVDRGPGAYVPQFQTAPATGIGQLPETARVRPAPPQGTRIVQQPVVQNFVSASDTDALPESWAEVTDAEPLAVSATVPAVPTIGSGVTVIITPQSNTSLPTVGAGAVAVRGDL